MVEDFERPDAPKVVAEILKGLVPDDQMGTDLVDNYGRFYEIDAMEPLPEGAMESQDRIVIRRKGGYLTQEFTDVIGLEVHTLARTRDRSIDLMHGVAQRILTAEGREFAGFLIDFTMTLAGPEEDKIDSMDDRIMVESYELHVRVNWT